MCVFEDCLSLLLVMDHWLENQICWYSFLLVLQSLYYFFYLSILILKLYPPLEVYLQSFGYFFFPIIRFLLYCIIVSYDYISYVIVYAVFYYIGASFIYVVINLIISFYPNDYIAFWLFL